MKIPTHTNGVPNGWLVEVWSARTSTYRPDQVYVTAVLPGKTKGPHLHMKRTGFFCCVAGNCDIIIRTPLGAYVRRSDIGATHEIVTVPPGCAAQIIGKGPGWEPALLINMPTPAWDPADTDEHEVLDWRPDV